MNHSNAHLYLPFVQALAEGKTVELQVTGNIWRALSDYDWSHPPDFYRIKPLSFPPKPEGMEWHNPDNLTAEQVGNGWRLLTTEDRKQREGEYHGNVLAATYRVPLSTPFPDGSRIVDGRLVKPWVLTRSLPGFRPLRDGEEWFDNGWTEELLPYGYRPMLKGELPLPGDEYDTKRPTGWVTQTGKGCILAEEHLGLFHRTRRPLPEPPAQIPLGPADWMKDGPWWIRNGKDDHGPCMVTGFTPSHIIYGDGMKLFNENVMLLERSNDGINWSPCSKPAP